jgi:hypothetical protein
MQKMIDMFNTGMDLGTAQVLLSKSCFMMWRDIGEKRPDFIYKRECVLAKELPEEYILEKLIGTIKILLGYERYQHINYLLSIFNLSDNNKRSLMQVIEADERLKRYPDVQRAFNECQGFYFNILDKNEDIATFPLIPSAEIKRKIMR